MPYIRTKGIIIREVNTGESDKSVAIFTREMGKVYAYARGARKYKGSISQAAGYFCYGEFLLYKTRDSYSIKSFQIEESFYNIRNDLCKLAYASHFAEIISYSVQEELPSEELLRLLLNTLHYLAGADCKSDDPPGEGRTPELLCAVFELRALAILGFGPETEVCAECGAEPGGGDFLFSFEKCGLVCGSCGKEDLSAISISDDTALAIRHIVQSDDGGLFAFRLKGKPLRELGAITRRYLRERLGHDFIKPDFIKQINF